MKKALENKEDIKLLVDSFYDRIKQNELLAPIFIDQMQVNWESHLPKMYDFWEMILFDGTEFRGAPMRAHLIVNNKVPLNSGHFEQWLQLFFDTVDELFEGEKADEVKVRAYNIANSWAYKMEYINSQQAESRPIPD